MRRYPTVAIRSYPDFITTNLNFQYALFGAIVSKSILTRNLGDTYENKCGRLSR